MVDSLQAVERAQAELDGVANGPPWVRLGALANDVLTLAAALATAEHEAGANDWFIYRLEKAIHRADRLEAFVKRCAGLNPNFGPMEIHGLVKDARAVLAAADAKEPS